MSELQAFSFLLVVCILSGFAGGLAALAFFPAYVRFVAWVEEGKFHRRAWRWSVSKAKAARDWFKWFWSLLTAPTEPKKKKAKKPAATTVEARQFKRGELGQLVFNSFPSNCLYPLATKLTPKEIQERIQFILGGPNIKYASVFSILKRDPRFQRNEDGTYSLAEQSDVSDVMEGSPDSSNVSATEALLYRTAGMQQASPELMAQQAAGAANALSGSDDPDLDSLADDAEMIGVDRADKEEPRNPMSKKGEPITGESV